MINKQHTIVIPPAYVSLCVCQAAMRYCCKPKIDRFVADKRSPFTSHVIGFLCEYAVSIVYKTEVDLSISVTGDKHKHDLMIGDKKIEVKGTDFGGEIKRMALRDDEIFKDTYYAFVYLQWPDTFIIYPLITGEQFIEHHEIWGNYKVKAITNKKIIEIFKDLP